MIAERLAGQQRNEHGGRERNGALDQNDAAQSGEAVAACQPMHTGPYERDERLHAVGADRAVGNGEPVPHREVSCDGEHQVSILRRRGNRSVRARQSCKADHGAKQRKKQGHESRQSSPRIPAAPSSRELKNAIGGVSLHQRVEAVEELAKRAEIRGGAGQYTACSNANGRIRIIEQPCERGISGRCIVPRQQACGAEANRCIRDVHELAHESLPGGDPGWTTWPRPQRGGSRQSSTPPRR